jgi:hypothetical protein
MYRFDNVHNVNLKQTSDFHVDLSHVHLSLSHVQFSETVCLKCHCGTGDGFMSRRLVLIHRLLPHPTRSRGMEVWMKLYPLSPVGIQTIT